MTEIAEGSSLISIVTGLFTKAIRDSFPDLEIAPNDCLVASRSCFSRVDFAKHEREDEARLSVQFCHGSYEEASGSSW